MEKEWWDVSPKEAAMLQMKLREEIKLTPLTNEPKTIAGADVSLNRFSSHGYAGIIVLSYPELEIVDHGVYEGTLTFPYIPGHLSFREIPLLEKAWQKLKVIPDVVMVDGQGIAHPRRLGIATHFGLIKNIPTLGCAKSILTGIHDELPNVPGAETSLIDPKTSERIGTLLRSKRNSNPLIISPGNLMSHDDAIHVTKSCLRGYRLPEPTRQAHLLVNRFRRGELGRQLSML